MQNAATARDGDSLIVTFPDGGKIIIENFFREVPPALPVLMPDGTKVPIIDLLKGLELPDGWDDRQQKIDTGSGIGNYSDDGGKLVNGISRLGAPQEAPSPHGSQLGLLQQNTSTPMDTPAVADGSSGNSGGEQKAPHAVNDYGALDAARNIYGNILTNDDFGPNGPAASGGIVGVGPAGGMLQEIPQGGSLTLQGQYGDLIIAGDGSFRYMRTNLMGPSDSETFYYTIKDSKGQESAATLTLSLKDDGAGVIPVISILSPFGVDFSESALENGTDPDPDTHSIYGPIRIMPRGQTFTLQITDAEGQSVTVRFNNDGTLSGGPYSITTQTGTLDIVASIMIAGQVSILYRYTLEHAINQTESAQEDPFTFTVRGSNGEAISMPLAISIKDDKPEAFDDTLTGGSGSTLRGNVLANDTFGADGEHPGGSVVGVVKGAQASASGSVGNPIQGDFGLLTVNADGSYSYTRTALMNPGDSDVFSYTIRDGDGSTATATITINPAGSGSVPVLNLGSDTVTVDESALATGTDPSGTGETGSGSFSINSNGEMCSAQLEHGGSVITLLFNANGTLASGAGLQLTGSHGVLTITGSSLVRGSIVVEYTYELTSAVMHPTGDGNNTATGDTFTVKATDATGDVATGSLNVSVMDDVPELSLAVNDLSVVAGSSSGRYDFYTLNAGADSAANTFLKVGPSGGVLTDVNGDTIITGTLGGQLKVYADGTCEYVAGATTGQDTFTFTYTDDDGDTVTQELVVSVQPAPMPTEISVIGYEAALPDGTAPNPNVLFYKLELNGGTVASASSPTPYGQVVQIGGDWYFQLTSAVTHDPGQGANIGTVSPLEPFTITLTNGDVYTVNVTLVDDVPRLRINGAGAADDTMTFASGASGSGAVHLLKGADQQADDSFTVTINGAETAVTANGTVITGAHGTLTINTDGTFRYTANPNATGTDTFTISYTDGDGDTVSKDLTCTVQKPALPEGLAEGLDSWVNEAGLDGGTGPLGPGTLGEIDLSNLPVGWGIVGVTQDDTTVPWGEIRPVGGRYFFILKAPVPHTGTGRDVTEPSPSPTITVQDSNGNTYQVKVPVQVADDIPVLGKGQDLAIEQSDAGAEVSGAFAGFKFGADGRAASGGIRLSGPSGLTSNGNAVTFSDNGKGVLTGTAGGQTVCTLTMRTDGTYSFALKGIIDGEGQKLKFPVVVKDADGDTASGSINVSVSPPPSNAPDDRFGMHLYFGSVNESAMSGDVLANDLAGATLIAVGNGAYGTASIDPATGKVVYTLGSDALTQMNGNGENPFNAPVRDYFTYTAMDASGHTYTKTVEVYIESAAYFTGYTAEGDVLGEIHHAELKDIYGSIAFTQGDDVFTGQNVIIGYADIDFKNGDNTLDMVMDTPGGGVSYSTLRFGSGADSVSLGAAAANTATAPGLLVGSTLSTGDGNDTVTLFHHSKALIGSLVELGAGNDSLHIYGDYSGGAASPVSLMQNDDQSGAQSSIYAGAGNDILKFEGGILNSGFVFGEQGDDVLALGVGSSSMAGPTLMLRGAVLDGGDNTAFNAAGGLMGDVLSLDAALSKANGGKELGGITSANTLNFESLHLGLTDGKADALNIDTLLDTLKDRGFTGNKAFDGIIITGDAADTVAIPNGAGWEQHGGGIRLSNDYYDGQTFTHYTLTYEGQQYEFMVQSGLL